VSTNHIKTNIHCLFREPHKYTVFRECRVSGC